MNNTTDRIIEVTDASVWFGDFNAVDTLSFHVDRGERVAILGRTGAGKSTLLNLLIGNQEPTSGTVRVAGKDPVSERKELQGIVSMAYQAPRLLPWRTAVGNVETGLEILKVDKAERRDRSMRWLEQVHLAGAENRFPNQLSGGMRQRVSLARAFAIDPELMFLDESFSALDEVTAKGLRSDFVTLCQRTNVSAVIVTHSIEEAFNIADRVLVFGRPARILGEFNAAEEMKAYQGRFSELRDHIHGLMIDAETPVTGGISNGE